MNGDFLPKHVETAQSMHCMKAQRPSIHAGFSVVRLFYGSLEIRRTERYRGFESHLFLQYSQSSSAIKTIV
jgi:hypothetical protein